jgi:DNA primase catalytic core
VSVARISEVEIERLKKTVPIAELIEASGVKLERRGGQLVGRCPWHKGGAERTPSLMVTPKKNLWSCKGACQVGGSPIDWIMKRDGVSFVRAVQALRLFAQRASRASEAPSAETTPAAPSLEAATDDAPSERTADDVACLEEVAAYYHRALLESPRALEYLEARGLVHPELIAHFGLGYADRTLLKTLPDPESDAGVDQRRRLHRVGVLARGSEILAGSLVIPIRDEHGRVVSMYGRRIVSTRRELAHRYLAGPHRAVFNVAALASSEEVILCEAMIDALTFWCAGYRSVISSYGVAGFTPLHLAAMKAHGTRRVLIAYDRDPAGDRAAESLSEQLRGEGISSYRVEFPKGMDANDYARKLKPASK